jgi:cell division protein ZapA
LGQARGRTGQESNLVSSSEVTPLGNANVEMNSVKVEIYGSEYRIRGDADPDYIQEIAHYVDSKMSEVSEETSLASSLKVAILAALNIAGELFRERDDRNRLLAQVQERTEELSQALDGELGD